MQIYPKLAVEIDESNLPAEWVIENGQLVSGLEFTAAELRTLKGDMRKAFPVKDFGQLNYHFHAQEGAVDE